MKTIQEWLQTELDERQISVREFSRKSGVAHTVLQEIVNGEMVDGRYPSVATLVKLAQFTKVDVCTLMSMLAPEETRMSAESMTLANRIERLPPEARSIIDDWLMGRMLKGNQQSD